MTLSLPFERKTSTPSEVNRLIKRLIEGRTEEMWVRGELSNVSKAGSGHVYFSLKDRESQLRAVLWRTQALKLRFKPADGMEVEVRGRISVYEPRGEYQLVAAEMLPAGLGALHLALEELKKKLAAEGFFDPAAKKPLPRFPAVLGIVTSESGAALGDIVRVARSRWPGIRILLAPVPVQGEGAAVEIADAVRRFNRRSDVDVLIVGRGGGSMEDLWAFNEEPVVRAVARSRIPVISAVGHETDVTLCDLAADVRAATPSNAAELAVPDAADLALRLARLDAALTRGITEAIRSRRSRIEAITAAYGFKRPADFLAQQGQRVDDAARRLGAAMERRVSDLGVRLSDLGGRLPRAAASRVERFRGRLLPAAARLESLDPTAVLGRGYCLVFRGDTPETVQRARDLAPGERVVIRFSADHARALIEKTADGTPATGE